MEKKISSGKISPNLWFATNAAEAAQYYTSIFKNSAIGRTSYYGKEGFDVHGMPEGTVLTVEFQIEGQRFVALNGGPLFQFNESISFIVNCDTQEEIDYYWEKLGAGGDPKSQVCGWLKDKFGVSWQVVPTIVTGMMSDKDQSKTERVMAAILKMKKIDINTLVSAYEQK
ncbi:VOC family protein [Chitinophaga vietnamensis]|uniref:VOC family protein n=1 Tax=Chitinophaga vietnamensis TaxID=2593957 RepID=UPI001178AFD5|nr:VOC family protein [Chitinophaga vietnamensis]